MSHISEALDRTERSNIICRPSSLTAPTLWVTALGLVFNVAGRVEAQTPPGAPSTGDACRKEICEGAVAGCLRADQSLNPFARTEAEKKQYCAQFYGDCLSRSITADFPWYSPDMVARFLRCPS